MVCITKIKKWNPIEMWNMLCQRVLSIQNIYIYIERERERERELWLYTIVMITGMAHCFHDCIYILDIYIYIHVYILYTYVRRVRWHIYVYVYICVYMLYVCKYPVVGQYRKERISFRCCWIWIVLRHYYLALI